MHNSLMTIAMMSVFASANTFAHTKMSLFSTEIPPLLQAAEKGEYELVKAFIKSGVYVDTADSKGRTALIVAAKNGHTRVVALLVACGAGVNAKTHKGKTALDYAREGGHNDIAKILLHHGALSGRSLVILQMIRALFLDDEIPHENSKQE